MFCKEDTVSRIVPWVLVLSRARTVMKGMFVRVQYFKLLANWVDMMYYALCSEHGEPK